MRRRVAAGVAALAAVLAGRPAAAEPVSLDVKACANIFASGWATAASGVLPPSYSFNPGPGKVLTFSNMVGWVQFHPSVARTGAEGGPWSTNLNSLNGISGIIHGTKAMFLVGVFLEDKEPSVAPAPLNFTGTDTFTSIAPLVGQTFFIGDGLTGTGSGARQQFVIPPTATRLFLGFAEGYNFSGTPGFYDDNEGLLAATFEITLACSYSISPPTSTVEAAGGTLTVTVATAAGCAWAANRNDSWLEIVAGSSGSGNGTVTYRVAANTGTSGTSARTGTLTVAGHTHTVFQKGAPACSYSLDRASATVPAAGGTLTVAVSAGAGCAWTASAAAAWITITAGALGAGSGSVTLSVAANTGAARTGTLTIAGRTFTVTQAAAGPQPAISPGGVVNAADYTAKLAPGTIFSIFGSNLAPATQAAASVPLPTSLEGVSVEIVDGGQPVNAPLFFVSAGQINAQLPFEPASSTVQVRVRTAQGTSNAETVGVLPRAPRLFTETVDGQRQAIALHADYTPVSPASPAAPGEALILCLTGLGAVSPAIVAGQAGGDGSEERPLNLVPETVTVTVGGQAATVLFAGLAPGFVGLYQLNIQAPEGLGAGDQAVVVRCGAEESQAGVTIAVRSPAGSDGR